MPLGEDACGERSNVVEGELMLVASFPCACRLNRLLAGHQIIVGVIELAGETAADQVRAVLR
jgi:hypothetical protein